jgi:AraC-like DNA-binding protein
MKQLAYYLQIGTTTSSVVFALVFIFYNWNKSLFKTLLIIQFVIYSFGLFIHFIALNNFFSVFPHLTRTGLLCALLIPPIQFLALKRGLKRENIKWLDLLHFLPAIIYIVNYYNYFILPASSKLQLLHENSIAAFSEGFLAPFILPLLSLIQTTFYLIWFLFLYNNFKKTIQSKALLRFIRFIMVFMVFHYLPVFMVILFYHDNHSIANWLPVIYALATLFFFFKILSTPEWLFEEIKIKTDQKTEPFNEFKKEELSKQEQLIIEKLSPKKTMLSKEELHILGNFTKFVEAERLFLNPSFSQKGVAEKLGVSEYKIRLLLDKAYGIKFSEFTNYRRTYFLLNEMRKNPQWKHYSFVAIARKLGYMSANSFYMNFKRITGVTPKEYFNSEN